jgi:predicted transcriptional regulator
MYLGWDGMADDDLVLEAVAAVVTGFVGNNRLPQDGLGDLIRSVHAAFADLRNREPAEEPQRLSPAKIRASIKPDALISFEDGRSYRTLKRHLTTKGLTPAEYREKWGLPKHYPMVAPNYSAARSELAKAAGLGKGGRKPGKGKGRVGC